MGKPELAIRKLRSGEEAIYRDFRIQMLTTHPAAFSSTAAEARALGLDWYARRIATGGDPRHFLAGAFSGGRLVATAGLSATGRLSERHKATLYGMAVHDDFAGQGIGGRLLSTLITEAQTIPGLVQITLSLTKGNIAAERLYRSAGFEVYGCEPRAIRVDDTYHDKLLMALRLD